MGRSIHQKDENTIAVFSTIIDDFIFEGTIKEYKEFRLMELINALNKEINDLKIDSYMNYETACNIRDSVHKSSKEE